MSSWHPKQSHWRFVALAAVGVLVAAAFALLAPAVAGANNGRTSDPRDVRGPLDIASVSHAHVGTSLAHTLRTYRPFSSKLLKANNMIIFGLDVNRDSKLERAVFVFWNRGALRGILMSKDGAVIELVRVGRPDSRSVKVTLPQRAVANAPIYRWTAATLFQSRQTCRKGCADSAPNHNRWLEHRLYYLDSLSVRVIGHGSVRSSPPGIAGCGTACSAKFKRGTTVTLTATPAPEQTFVGWGGACTGTGACRVKLSRNASVTATFERTYQPQLAVSVTGAGSVRLIPPDVRCSEGMPCTQRYDSGTVVTLTVEMGPSLRFDGWSGACTGTNPVCTLTMDGDKSVSAAFSIRPFTLAVSLELGAGASGRVVSSPPGIDCPGDCSESYTNSTYVMLTAVPGPDSVFAGWSGLCWASGLNPTCEVLMGASDPQDKSVTAAFAHSSS